jgi:hypothetical protein
MKRERIRLRPTGLWLLFGPILGCMWLAAVNYSNNLVYGVLYLVASLTFVSIFHSWRNLSSVEIEHVRVHPAFARGEIRLEIHLRNSGAKPAYGIFFARGDHGRDIPLRSPDGRGFAESPHRVSLRPGPCQLPPARARGLLRLPGAARRRGAASLARRPQRPGLQPA